MSTRNLHQLFRPRSVAVVGASDRPASVGALVLRNLVSAGFEGPIWPVNPKHAMVGARPAWPDVLALPQAPDLAIICSPASTVPLVVEQLGRRGCKAAIVLGAGLRSGVDAEGVPLEQAMLRAARPHLLRILGPNCIGLLTPGLGLNASFAQAGGLPGRLAFVSQSGALATAMLDWGNARGIGFSHFVSLGDSADVDVADVLDYLAEDPGTDAILLYLESIRAARKFMSAARAAASNKPVLVVKAGRAPEGAKAAASHTGALAASDEVVDAAIRRAGMLRVDTLADLFDAAETLARAKHVVGERIALVTNGGGAGVLAADALSRTSGRLVELDTPTRERLDRVLPPTWSHGNPVDIIGDAPAPRYVETLQAILASPQVDTLLFMHAPSAIVPAVDVAKACLPVLTTATKPALTCWLGGASVSGARDICRQAGLPVYETPEQAVAGFGHLLEYRRNQAALQQVPPAAAAGLPLDLAAADRILRAAAQAGSTLLDEPSAKALLAACGIPVAATEVAQDVDAAVRAADRIGFPVVLKILSPQISHKSDVGGVALDLSSAAEVRRAAEAMAQRVRAARPDARLDGFTVQAMVKKSRAHELIVGAAVDPVFGPILLFGQGGTSVEVTMDRAIGLPPLDGILAADLIRRTRVSRLLAGYRDRPPACIPSIVDVLERLSQMVCALPLLAELDINPLLVDEDGAIALDARVVVLPRAELRQTLAIRPYPAELEETVQIDGATLQVRPVRPQDRNALQALHRASASPAPCRAHIDYDREMALLAWSAGEVPSLVGEARARCDPDLRRAQMSLAIDPDRAPAGLREHLVGKMTRYLASRGVEDIQAASP